MTRFVSVTKLVGMLVMLFSLTLLPPYFVSLWYHDGAEWTFILAFTITFFIGFISWYPFYHHKYELKTRDGFLIVALAWTILSLLAAFPIYFDTVNNISIVNSLFESVSGLTTTGATIFKHLDALPRSILYYRQQLHLLGGLGIVVIAVAVLPMLGIGGMQLYRAETIGSVKTNRLHPRITEAAKSIWYIYLGLVVTCAVCFKLAGMTYFDAIGESFSTIATGGFSMHDSSFSFYHSEFISYIAIFFMIVGATNFSLHFQAIHQRSLSVYNDAEFKSYLKIMLTASIIIMLVLSLFHFYANHHHIILMNVIFTVVSISSTTGFSVADYSHWPTFIPYMIMFLAMLGGCGGSTSGGIKVIRFLLLRKQGERELAQLIHPQSVISIKLGKNTISEKVLQSVWGYVAIFVLSFMVLLLLLIASGLELNNAFGALASCMSNTGSAVGIIEGGFHALPSSSKWILIFAMLIGRLEIFTILVLFMPAYWRK